MNRVSGIKAGMPDQMCRGGKFIFSRIKEATAEGCRCHATEVVLFSSIFLFFFHVFFYFSFLFSNT
jgi:hypothetical protein